eukprot:scaffold2684_cov124-Isochrysis_galbana.AAC.10
MQPGGGGGVGGGGRSRSTPRARCGEGRHDDMTEQRAAGTCQGARSGVLVMNTSPTRVTCECACPQAAAQPTM